MNDPTSSGQWTLRDLPFAARSTIALFLITVGLGYFSALVNLHFQEATPGSALPTGDDVQRSYRGKSKVSQLERLLVAHPSLPFNGQGSMRSVFTKRRASGWEKERKRRAKELGIDYTTIDDNPKKSKELDQYVAKIFDGERMALVAWLREGALQQPYEDDAYELKEEFAKLVVNPKVVVVGPKGAQLVKIKTILENRCVTCHADKDDRGGAGQFPLTNYEELTSYTRAERSTGKSLSKLALTTHVHLLSFGLLYGLTGLLFALTGYWNSIRVLIAPLPLLAQVVDCSFWWLARMDEPYGPMFADGIRITGGIVAVGLGLQILLTLFYLFGRIGKAFLFIVIVFVAGGLFGLKDKALQYLENEKSSAGIEAIEK